MHCYSLQNNHVLFISQQTMYCFILSQNNFCIILHLIIIPYYISCKSSTLWTWQPFNMYVDCRETDFEIPFAGGILFFSPGESFLLHNYNLVPWKEEVESQSVLRIDIGKTYRFFFFFPFWMIDLVVRVTCIWFSLKMKWCLCDGIF